MENNYSILALISENLITEMIFKLVCQLLIGMVAENLYNIKFFCFFLVKSETQFCILTIFYIAYMLDALFTNVPWNFKINAVNGSWEKIELLLI